jgi:hypothetical protein
VVRKIKIRVKLESSSTLLQELQNVVLPMEVTGLQGNSGNVKYKTNLSRQELAFPNRKIFE